MRIRGTLLAVSLLLSATFPSLARAATEPVPASASAPILMYHHIAAPPRGAAAGDAQYFVDPSTFDQQIFYLLSHGFTIVSLDDVVNALSGGMSPQPKSVAITIDDGWQDFWQNGLRIVRKYAVPATVFAIADADKASYMTPSERWVLAHSGVTVAAHTLTHPHLTKLLPAVARAEIGNSRGNLEKELGVPVQLFAYPYGDFNAPVEAMVQAAGYRAAFAAGPGTEEDNRHLFELPRVMVSFYDSPDTFANKAADYRWARRHGPPLAPEPTRPLPIVTRPAPQMFAALPAAAPAYQAPPAADPGPPTRLLDDVSGDAALSDSAGAPAGGDAPPS